ncbi:rhodanese-like domain-containing protein [Planococcus sp. ISL-109]|uniref:rhodanese-like domain-containing protein n=1 Tax=Planococcus sp. ISL-109 TaxID=2819166 RepID=UPI001BE9156F|nr:rhodanese-like domain-containing protein [Planococcus sp. ISL-109]MBT2581180.1 rhodanese-like domain-containing protein [Planococcus sp. ISL-109]
MKRWLGLVVLIVLMLGACGSGKYETIAIDEVEAKQQAGYTVLDVREPFEYEEAHIVGAENKPLSVLREDEFSGLSEDQEYVVICQTGNRSQEASAILHEAGYEVLNVSEGMSTWTGDVE